jgi:hypothetical protein
MENKIAILEAKEKEVAARIREYEEAENFLNKDVILSLQRHHLLELHKLKAGLLGG